MGKRSDFEKKELAFYPTPMAAVIPLLSRLPPNVNFCEPCAGEGHLIKHLESYGHKCVSAFDVKPRVDGVYQQDAAWMTKDDLGSASYIITNPPWEREPLHQIIERCASLAPTWLLFDADWMHTRQASAYMALCCCIVSVGRVKWIEESNNSGKDNCCWYLFDFDNTRPATFYGRK